MSKKHRKKHIENESLEAPKQYNRIERISIHAILVLLVIIVYANTYNAAFVSDDTYGILNNPLVFQWSSVTSQLFRFLQPLIYFLMSNIFGLVPFAFRAWNILAHIGTVQLIFVVMSTLFTPVVGFFAAALFAVHPIAIESVTWISGGTFSWFTFFMMSAWYFYMKRKNHKGWYIASILCYWLGVISGAPAVVFFGVFFLYECIFGQLKKNWHLLIPFFLLSTIYGVMLILGTGARETAFREQHYQTTQYYNWFLQMPVAITTYFQIFFWPAKLSLYHSELQFTTAQFVVKVIGLIIYIAACIFTFFKHKKYFFLLALFFIGLVPTLTPQTVHWVTAERYVYMSMIGIVTLVALLLAKIPRRFELGMYLLFVAFLVGFTVRSIVRNVDWKNEDNLWIATAKTSPSDPKTHNNLADVYMRHKDFKKAAEELIIAIKINPGYADAYHNLGNVYQQVGQVQPALQMYQRALQINPRLWQTHQNLASLYFGMNDFEKAAIHMKAAADMQPYSAQLRAFAGFIQLKGGKKAEAIVSFEQALRLDPQNPVALSGLVEARK